MPGANLPLYPRPPAPWIDIKTGQPMPEFYRFIVSLLNLSGGGPVISLDQLDTLVETAPRVNTSVSDHAVANVATLVETARQPITPQGLLDALTLIMTQRQSPIASSAGSDAATFLFTARRASQLPRLTLTGDVTGSGSLDGTGGVSIALTIATAQPAVHTWAQTQTFTVAPVFTDQSGSRTALGLGTAAAANTGVSGHTLPFADGVNTWSGAQTFTAGITVGTGVLMTSNVALTDNTGAQVATLNNGPSAGNPTKWIEINDNGVTRSIPAW